MLTELNYKVAVHFKFSKTPTFLTDSFRPCEQNQRSCPSQASFLLVASCGFVLRPRLTASSYGVPSPPLGRLRGSLAFLFFFFFSSARSFFFLLCFSACSVAGVGQRTNKEGAACAGDGKYGRQRRHTPLLRACHPWHSRFGAALRTKGDWRTSCGR